MPGVVQSWSATQIVAQVAAGSASGVVQVLNNGSASGTVAFGVQSLQLLSASPVTGGAGTTVTLTGTGFGATQGAGFVTLGSTAGTVVSWSDTAITATVASGSISGVARVQVSGGGLSNALGFKVPGSPGSASLIAPSMLNMLVGDSRSLQALSSTGQPMLGLTWTSSNTAVVSLSSDDPPVLSALTPGRVTIAAGGASADVVVMAGDQFPVGTTAWSTPLSGGGSHTIIPAVPSATGVADVFAVAQGGGSISAVTSEGVVAWTTVVSPPGDVIADFQGGVVVVRADNSIVRLNGMTGAASGSFSVGANKEIAGVAVHLDGTIFAAVRDPAAAPDQMGTLVGIDPATGGQKFSVPVDVQSTIGFLHRPMIAGDGYAYVPYATREFCGYDCATPYQLNLLRVSSAGAASTIGLTSWRGPWGDAVPVSVSMITNADTGVYVSIGTNDGYFSATTNGLNVSLGGAPVLPGQEGPFRPMLQAQDGSFVGEANLPGGHYMVASEANGGVRWAVRGESPLMALAGGIFLAESGVRYNTGGAAMGRDGRPPVFHGRGLPIKRCCRALRVKFRLLQCSWLRVGGHFRVATTRKMGRRRSTRLSRGSSDAPKRPPTRARQDSLPVI